MLDNRTGQVVMLWELKTLIINSGAHENKNIHKHYDKLVVAGDHTSGHAGATKSCRLTIAY
jgi:hypothetical protein